MKRKALLTGEQIANDPARRVGQVPIVKITGQGLSAIALSVALLWACLIAERRISSDATEARSRTLLELRLLRTRAPNGGRTILPAGGLQPAIGAPAQKPNADTGTCDHSTISVIASRRSTSVS